MTASVPGPVPTRDSPPPRSPRRFATTRWSLIRQARHLEESPARAALEELVQAYWLPVYAFMRRQTQDIHEAQDWTQGLFASLLSRDAFAQLNPELGRFRSFLLAAAKHYASNERDRKSANIRGGHVVLQSLDYEQGEQRLTHELSRESTAEHLFERQWALAILERVLEVLRQDYERTGQSELFQSLSEHLAGDANAASLISIADGLQMSPEAVRVALHRMRKKYRLVLRQEISQTTDSADDVDDEIRHLFRALSAS